MDYFTIKDVENLSGIKAHTWRIWEKRHQICLPQRKVSNHRFYDAENLKHILRISYLYNSGIKISRIAKLNDDEIIALATKTTQVENTEIFYVKELLEASINFDVIKFENTCIKIFESFTTEDAVLNIVFPFLERIGMLWLTNHIIPAQEHFTSNIIRHQIIIAINKTPHANIISSSCTLLFTPEKELHEIPLLFIHYLLKKAGKKVCFFGCNIKLDVLKEYMKYEHITHLHFHSITNFAAKDSQQYLQYVAEEFPEQHIIMSGRQASQITNSPINCTILSTPKSILSYYQ